MVTIDRTALDAMSVAEQLDVFARLRGRRLSRGVFVDEAVLAAAEISRAAARVAASGRCLPDLVEEPGGVFRAVWRALVAAPAEPDAAALFARYLDGHMRFGGRTPLETGNIKVFTPDDAWLTALRGDDARVDWPNADDLRGLQRRLAEWRAPLAVSADERAALVFCLVPPETLEGPWRLRLEGVPRTRAGVTSLGQAANVFAPIQRLRAQLDASALVADLSTEETEAFLRTGAAALAAAGYATRVPDGLVGEHVSAAVDLADAAERPVPGGKAPPAIAATVTIHVDGEKVSAEEIEFLLDQNSPFVFFRDHWIEVDRGILKEALRALRSTQGKKLPLREAVGFAIGLGRAGRLRVEEARAHGWLRGLLNELRGGEGFHVLPPPTDLRADLRDYQQRGFSWLVFLAKWGFGPCLADDMGLGKTVQAIAFLLQRRADGAQGPALVVAPVSVTANWMRELARFAPTLRAHLHQGPARLMGGSFTRAARRADVVVTGYPQLVKDFRDLSTVAWSALVLDEAQTVRNPETRTSQAARALPAPVKVALTGTPLENGPGDLWALEEFLNPGLLGDRRDFTENFVRPIADGARSVAAKLRRVIEPFLLRRLKTDPGVAAELGPKRDVREYCTLSADQRSRYEAALAAYRRDAAADASAGRRSGRMLALLTELKLICDGDGKYARLDELLAQIFAAGESALVFTQYAKVGAALRAHLAEEFGREYPFLHGGLSPAAREEEIAAFNASAEPNAFILSLRAGGFGLNLTRATHVIHFDRWWNPAVENQATDRAHRIGQTGTVFVHVFICQGTLEDRIDELLETKRELAGDVVKSGESFLLGMSDAEFERTVALA